MTEGGYRRGILGVALATAVLCLPFLGSLPLFDPDEGYYPATAAESLAHGHPFDLTLNGEPRWNKPPLSYALMQGGILVFGRNEFAVRLPSVLEGAALVAILGLVVARVAGGRAGLLSSVVLASSLGFQILTRAAHPEMGLVLGTAAAQLLLALWFVSPAGERPRWAWWAAGIAMGFGFLAKGPSVLAMPALMLLAGMVVVLKEGRPTWGEVGRAFGGAVLLALALAAPWFLWMGAKHGDAFWSVAFGQMEHLTEERHRGFRENPFFFVPVLLAAFLPWVLLLRPGLKGLSRSDPSPAARFPLLMALAAGSSFLFWSLAASRNPHYALVFLPPLAAIVGASEAGRISEPRAPWEWRTTANSLLALGLILLVLTPAESFFDPMTGKVGPRGGWVNPYAAFTNAPQPIPGGHALIAMQQGVGIVLVLGGLVARLGRSLLPRVGGLAAVGALALPVAIAFAGPLDAHLRPIASIAESIRQRRDPDDLVVVYRERVPSLTFLLGSPVRRARDPDQLRGMLEAPGRPWLLVERLRDPNPARYRVEVFDVPRELGWKTFWPTDSPTQYLGFGSWWRLMPPKSGILLLRRLGKDGEVSGPGSPPPPAPAAAPPAAAPPPAGGPR